MAEDWLVDVRKYVPDADEGVVGAIVRYCGIALQSRDSSLVAMSDKQERELVRENYLKKKLGLTHSDAELDEAVIAVGQVMKEDRTKNRVTVYYLLAQHFGLLNMFGGVAGAAGAAGVAAAAMGNFTKDEDTSPPATPPATPPAAPLAAAGLGAAGLAGAGMAAAAPEPVAAYSAPPPAAEPVAAYSTYDNDVDTGGGGLGWLKWLLLAAVLLALIFFGVRYCSKPTEQAVAEPSSTAATSEVDQPANTTMTTPAEPAVDTTATATPAAAVPQGSGVTAGERGGRPMLTVYFDTGKSAVSNDLAAASSKLKEYMAKNPDAKIAVSGFNDPTGNAAANAELSKNRAKAVAKAIADTGIPAASIALEKPAQATGTGTSNAESRRVEVVVKP
jgi:outer membrane protein OmpA-like peptidoglycan-associated protein